MKKLFYCLTLVVVFISVYLFFFHQKSVIKETPVHNNQSSLPPPIPIETQSQSAINTPVLPFVTPDPSVRTFDMKLIDQECSPCEKEACFPRDPNMIELVQKFYNTLKAGQNNIVIKMLQENENLFPNLFPFCSAHHTLLVSKLENWTIVLLTGGGNWFPSVPNDHNYFFGRISTTSDTIELIEKNIDSYFDGSLGQKYATTFTNGDDKNMILFLDQIQSQRISEFKKGVFPEPRLQEEYSTFINTP